MVNQNRIESKSKSKLELDLIKTHTHKTLNACLNTTALL